MTGQTIPRIGQSNPKSGLIQLVKLVSFEQPIPEDELIQKMEKYNENNPTKIFQTPSELIDFAREEKSSSIQILSATSDGYVLNETGQELLQADEIDKALFELLIEKSKTEFVYFWEVIRNLDRMYKEEDHALSSNLIESINSLIESGNNKVTAGTIGGLLREFELIEKGAGGFYRLDPDQYAYLRGDKQDIFLEVLEDQSNHRIEIGELEELMTGEYEWTHHDFEEVLKALKSQGMVQTDRFEGKQVVERVVY